MAVEKTFTFAFREEGREKSLAVPINLPFTGQQIDFIERLVLAHDLPAYVHSDLQHELTSFIKTETQQWRDAKADESLRSFLSRKPTVGENVESQWTGKYCAEHAECSGSVEQSEEAAFAQVYYSLIHSPALETLLQLEHSYAANVEQEILEMERARKKMQER